MFGYVIVNKPELKVRELETYQSYYCGLCKQLREKCGFGGQLSLSYDMTFLAMLLTGLYEPEETEDLERCVRHPVSRHRVKKNAMIGYVADMNLLLTWYKCKDDVRDEKRIDRGIYAASLHRSVRTLGKQYERQAEAVRVHLDRMHALETDGCKDLDALSGCFGALLGELFVIKEDEWASALRKMGCLLGRFIYVLDAYDDMERDAKKGCFNPLLLQKRNETDDWIYQVLTLYATELATEFEKLPILQNVEILRNILYAGIWTRYAAIRADRKKNQSDDRMEA